MSTRAGAISIGGAGTVGWRFIRCGGRTLRWLDKIPLPLLLLAAIGLGVAPVFPEPHLLEKIRMLGAGTLSRPIDIFDLLLHGTPIVLLAVKLARMALARR